MRLGSAWRVASGYWVTACGLGLWAGSRVVWLQVEILGRDGFRPRVAGWSGDTGCRRVEALRRGPLQTDWASGYRSGSDPDLFFLA